MNSWKSWFKLLLVVLALALPAFWLGRGVIRVTSSITDVSLPYFWWWALGIPVAITVIVILWKNRAALGSGGKKIRLKWIFWPVAIAGAIVLVKSWEWSLEERFADYFREKNLGGLPVLAMGRPVSGETTLAIIAECESGGRQFDEEGNLIVHSESGAIGKYQILPSWHEEDAEKLGLDIRTEEGNEAFAKVLFEKFGTEPWEASRKCWGDKVSAPYAETFSGETIATGFVHIGTDWSKWVRVPAGQELFFQRVDENVSFEVELQNGETFEFQRNFAGHKRFPLIQRIRFRVTDKEAKELSVWLRFSPLEVT